MPKSTPGASGVTFSMLIPKVAVDMISRRISLLNGWQCLATVKKTHNELMNAHRLRLTGTNPSQSQALSPCPYGHPCWQSAEDWLSLIIWSSNTQNNQNRTFYQLPIASAPIWKIWMCYVTYILCHVQPWLCNMKSWHIRCYTTCHQIGYITQKYVI